jgi:ribulose kinase
MSGGQAKNMLLMKLFANVCGMPVVLPHSHSLAVVLGAAMLGRFADEVTRKKLEGDQIGESLWKIMVCYFILLL